MWRPYRPREEFGFHFKYNELSVRTFRMVPPASPQIPFRLTFQNHFLCLFLGHQLLQSRMLILYELVEECNYILATKVD